MNYRSQSFILMNFFHSSWTQMIQISPKVKLQKMYGDLVHF